MSIPRFQLLHFISFYRYIPVMSSLVSIRAIARCNLFAGSRPRSLNYVSRRGLATQADDGKLPLKGLKVLDMTRVLAGVRLPLLFCLSIEYSEVKTDPNTSPTVHKSLATSAPKSSKSSTQPAATTPVPGDPLMQHIKRRNPRRLAHHHSQENPHTISPSTATKSL